MRRLLVLTTLLLALLGAVAGCGDGAGPGQPGPSTSTTIVVPDVTGHNAAVAVDELTKLGFTNIELGTVDGRPAVVLPQNWTVREQSAAAGTSLRPDDKIVLGCARIGEDHWPFT